MTGIVKTDQIQGAGSSTVTIPTDHTLAVTSNATVGGTLGVTGATTLSGDLTITDKIIHSGDTDTTIRFSDANEVKISTGGTENIKFELLEKIYQKQNYQCQCFYALVQ